MHSVFLNQLASYMVVFSIPKLLDPSTQKEVGWLHDLGVGVLSDTCATAACIITILCGRLMCIFDVLSLH